MDVSIRRARRRDRSALGALKLRSSLAWGEHVEELTALAEASEVPEEHLAQALVARDGDIILGFVTVLARDDGEGEIEDLFVAPDAWRRGVGRRLVAAAEAAAVSAGLRSLRVVAGERALPFYERSGFKVAGKVQTRFAPALLLRKMLG
jgi:GNAT superfamily N-acetyltransferase